MDLTKYLFSKSAFFTNLPQNRSLQIAKCLGCAEARGRSFQQ